MKHEHSLWISMPKAFPKGQAVYPSNPTSYPTALAKWGDCSDPCSKRPTSQDSSEQDG